MLETTRETTERLERLIPKVIRMLHRGTEHDELEEFPVNQIRVLLLLFDGPATPTQVGEELNLSPSAVSQVTKKLEQAGMLERSDDPHDRRVRHLRLSASGNELLDRRFQARIDCAQSQIERLTEAERVNLIHIMEKLATETAENDSVLEATAI